MYKASFETEQNYPYNYNRVCESAKISAKITQKCMLMNITRLYYAGVITRCNRINV